MVSNESESRNITTAIPRASSSLRSTRAKASVTSFSAKSFVRAAPLSAPPWLASITTANDGELPAAIGGATEDPGAGGGAEIPVRATVLGGVGALNGGGLVTVIVLPPAVKLAISGAA